MTDKPIGRRLEIISVKNFGDVEIRIHVASGTFHADLLGERLNSANKKELVEQIYKTVTARAKIKWIPVIEVSDFKAYTDRRYQANPERGNVELKIERYWVARQIGDERNWLQSDWEYANWRPEADKVGATPLRDVRTERAHEVRGTKYDKLDIFKPSAYHYSGSFDETIYLSYSEPLWLALADLIQRMHALNAAIADLVTSADGRQALVSGSALLQLAGPRVPDEH